jgi:hypothetical protein
MLYDIRFPNLHKLALDETYARLLRRIKAPNLKELCLTSALLNRFLPMLCSFLDETPYVEKFVVNSNLIN